MRHRVWTEITLHLSPEHQDLLIGQLAHAGFTGFLQEANLLACFIEQVKWNAGMQRSLRSILANVKREFPSIDVKFHRKSVRDRNWSARWEQSVGIVEATDRIIIKPSWKKLGRHQRGKIVLHIDPKMAFGTGHHETTRLCLVLLQEYVRSGMQVLDFGSGTGIQAIAAIKLGARAAVAIDNDEWAADNARENVNANRVSKQVKVIAGDMKNILKRRFDLIVANIDIPTLTNTLSALSETLKSEGILILSGLLTGDLPQFMESVSQQDLVPLEIIDENEWVAIALTNVHANHGD